MLLSILFLIIVIMPEYLLFITQLQWFASSPFQTNNFA